MIDIEKPLENAIAEATPELPKAPPPDTLPPAEGDYEKALSEYDATVRPPAPEAAEPEPDFDLDTYIRESQNKYQVHIGREALLEGAEYVAAQIQHGQDSLDAQYWNLQMERQFPEVVEAIGLDAIGSFVAGLHQTNPAFRDAWDNRHSDEARWNTIFQRTGGALERLVQGQYDKEATESREAIVAHMTSGRNRGPGFPSAPPDFGNMSDQEVSRYCEANYGFATIR